MLKDPSHCRSFCLGFCPLSTESLSPPKSLVHTWGYLTSFLLRFVSHRAPVLLSTWIHDHVPVFLFLCSLPPRSLPPSVLSQPLWLLSSLYYVVLSYPHLGPLAWVLRMLFWIFCTFLVNIHLLVSTCHACPDSFRMTFSSSIPLPYRSFQVSWGPIY